ncbi:MAG: peptidoglycan-binding domain-containing protein [Janthinobacterium lividum]
MIFVDRSRRPVPTRRTRNLVRFGSVAVSAALLSLATPCGNRTAYAATAVPATPTGAAFLIGNGKSIGLPALPDCEPALRSLGDRLRRQGDDVTEIMDAPGPALRAAIGSFAGRLPSSGRVLVAYCGYAMADTDKLFLLPADAAITGPADLPRQAIIARTVSRILSAHSSMFLAELYAPPSVDKGTTVLQSAIQSLREETAPDTRLSIAVNSTPAGAPLIEAFTSTVSASKDWASIPAAGASAPPVATAPDAAVAKPDANAATGSDDQPPAGDKPTDAQATLAAAAVPPPANGSLKTAHTSQDATGGNASAVSPASPSGSSPINLAPPRKAPRPVVVSLPDGDTGSATVRRIQSALARHGLMKGAITGHDDQDTQKAVSAYQSSLNHPATGFLTYPEMNALESKFITSTLPAPASPSTADAGDSK